jgi:hypothetical protein
VSHELSSPTPGSQCTGEGGTIFDQAVKMLEHQKAWINWADPYEIAGKTAAAAAAIMTMGPISHYMDRLLKLFLSAGEKGNRWDYRTLELEYVRLRDAILVDCTKFIVHAKDKAEIGRGWELYKETIAMCDIISFIVIYKPCCRLSQMTWLIPAVAMGVPALPLICYAAEELADLMNNPLEPFKADCTPVGNSWLHRLGIYLLHQCAAQRLPPDPALIRLMSLVTPPPSASVKSGKATRYSDYLANPSPVHYLHETPPAQAVGTALALELLGEFDANRQGEHFRRVERAAAYDAGSMLNGRPPSVKSIQQASGLSWADTKVLVRRPLFRRLVFEYQCRFLLAEMHPDCPECKALAPSLRQSKEGDSPIRSSGSSW